MGFQVREQQPVAKASKPIAKKKLAPEPPQGPPRGPSHVCPRDRLVLGHRAQDSKVVTETLERQASAATTPGAAMDVFDKAHESGLKDAATHALKRAIDLCENQRDGLQVAKTADFLGYKEAAEYAYKVVEGLPSSEEFPF